MAKTSKTAAVDPNVITGYCMKTKTKNVPLQDCKINRRPRGSSFSYNALGHDGNENKISSIVTEEKALAAIEAGTAVKGDGWGSAKTAPKKK